MTTNPSSNLFKDYNLEKEKELVLKRVEENLEDEQERIKMAEAQERIKEEHKQKRRKWARLDQIEAEED